MSTYTIHRYGQAFSITVEGDKFAEEIYARGELSEQPMLDWIERNVPRGGLWIDGGANVGNHTMAFSLWADAVLAFEPMRVNLALLLGNLKGWCCAAKVAPFLEGLSDKPGKLGAVMGGTGQNCQWILQPDTNGFVNVTTVDDRVNSHGGGLPVRLIKLDVEGMEPQALAGARQTLEHYRPELFMEIWEDEVLEQIKAYLAPLGYILIERYNVAPTYHFSASGRYPVTYTKPPQPSSGYPR